MNANRFFSTDSAKAIKAKGLGYLNAINYMAPANTAGAGNLCPHASPGCLSLCLGWYSGQSGMISNAELETGSNATRASRARKSVLFMHERQAFIAIMQRGIDSVLRQAQRAKLTPCVRPNGATDIVWESVCPSMFAKYRGVQFVDYTKNYRRMLRFCAGMLPSNYHLTFSRSETNEAQCLDVLAHGGNVAVVFAGEFPSIYLGRKVINGDLSDLRHLDEKGGVIVALSPKGRKTKNDTSGFVVRL